MTQLKVALSGLISPRTFPMRRKSQPASNSELGSCSLLSSTRIQYGRLVCGGRLCDVQITLFCLLEPLCEIHTFLGLTTCTGVVVADMASLYQFAYVIVSLLGTLFSPYFFSAHLLHIALQNPILQVCASGIVASCSPGPRASLSL